MPWVNTQIYSPIPQEFKDIVASINSTIGSINAILAQISNLLQAASVFIVGTTDLFNALVSALFDELNNLINDFFGTGVYMLTIHMYNTPGILKHDNFGIPLLYPKQAIEQAIASLDDLGDANRPQFSNGAQISAFGLMMTAHNVPDFLGLLQRLLAIFEVPDLKFCYWKTLRKYQPPVVPSVPPDWRSLKFNSINSMAQMQIGLLDILEMLRGYATVPDTNIPDLIAIIDAKVTRLQKALDDMANLLNILAGVCSGIYVMNLPITLGGNNRLKLALHDSKLEQCYPLNGYTAMALFVGGGPSLQPVENIRALITGGI